MINNMDKKIERETVTDKLWCMWILILYYKLIVIESVTPLCTLTDKCRVKL